jgi:DNA-binding response OmpR family regulator
MYLTEISKAVETGAAMTKQLLAFSRKGEVEFEIFAIDKVVGAQEALLRRLLGEDIDFQVRTGAGKSQVCADVGQLNQVLMNLAVNARDAMPTGGRLSIETKTVTVGTAMAENLEPGEELPAGQYVSLVVADNGVGMSSKTRVHLFEPFYTTKEPGQGTGLGLATVYGIVKQAGGHIDVRAVQPRGTRFEILLPVVFREHSAAELQSKVVNETACNETILLCEDDHLVRMSLRYYLEGAGYRVLTSKSAADAIERCRNSPGPIDLLLTDVVLPDESGERIARSIRALQPGIKVLYMSAHTAQWLKRKGRIDNELPTLQKPFSENFLLARVAKILEAPNPTPKIERRAAPREIEQPAALASAPPAVLLVDDDDAIRLSLGHSLQELGYEVLSASDGLEAVALATDHDGPIAALVVDVVLPKLMGVAVAREVQTMHPNSRIIYMSGYPRDVALQEEVVGAALFAQKPVHVAKLHEMMSGPQPADAAIIKTSPGRIMVVEDSSAARLAIAEFLIGEGWGVDTAENGADALSLLRGRNYELDVLLVDYSLPDIKGDVLAARVREVHSQVAVAYMSGYSGLSLDPPGPLLTKPLDLDTLTATLLALHEA